MRLLQEKFENNTVLLKTLKKAVEDKTLEKVGGSYKIPGEAYAPPADETVTIKELEQVRARARPCACMHAYGPLTCMGCVYKAQRLQVSSKNACARRRRHLHVHVTRTHAHTSHHRVLGPRQCQGAR
jgi:hypothetical protein